MLRKFAVLLALVATLAGPAFAQAAQFDKIIVFGDSLSDNGNLYAATGGQLLPLPYSEGRASNGAVWVEYLSLNLDVPMDNRAVVGALTGEGKNDPPPSLIALGVDPEALQIPAVGKQIVDYLIFDKPTPDSLVVIWAGANDIFFGGADNEQSVDNISKHVRKLARNGAATFLIPNLPPLERTPYGVLFADPATQAALQYLSYDFNLRLAAELNELEQELGVTIIQFDVYTFLNTVIDHPGAFGFTDVVTPSAYVYGPNPPPGYLFFDDVHPTTQGHGVLAEEAQSVIENALVP